MIAHTVLLDFKLSSKLKLTDKQMVEDGILLDLQNHFDSVKMIANLAVEHGFFMVFTGPKDILITVRVYMEGLVTMSIEFSKQDDEDAVFSFDAARELEKDLHSRLAYPTSYTLAPIKRGGPFQRYFPTADERLLEYDIDRRVHSCRSAYQTIQIVHSKSLGNLLVLDALQNVSEADLIYTETLMQRGKENYDGKEILILGGGDGGLLWELLKENPKYVTMLEIDLVVIEVCRKYMRSVCGDCLDKMKGDNYEIKIGDCAKVLADMIAEGRQFDYVFGDLTDMPINTGVRGDGWDFIRLILNSAVKVLKPNGKYMTHGNGASCLESLEMYENALNQLSMPVTFTKDQAFVPSFFEDWVFYQVSRQ